MKIKQLRNYIKARDIFVFKAILISLSSYTAFQFYNLFYKAGKPSVCLSVRLHHGITSVLTVCIDFGLYQDLR